MQENASLAESLASLSEANRIRLLADLTEHEAEALLNDWRFWARPKQLAPPGDWTTWLVLAGRGFGKTRCGAEWVRAKACGKTPFGPGTARRIALVAETAHTQQAGCYRGALKSQHHHTDIIRRFGQYPHRNQILGRDNTDAEVAFLAGPGSSF